MGRVKMGKAGKMGSNKIEPEVIEVEKIVEVPVEKVVEVEKIVEVPKEVLVRSKESEINLKSLYKHAEKKAEEASKKAEKKIQDSKEEVMKALHNLGESSAESFDKVVKKSELHEEVINAHGSLLIYLRNERNKNEKKRKRILKRVVEMERKQKKINQMLAAGVAVGILLAIII